MSDDHFALDEGLRQLSKVLVGNESLETTLQRIVNVTERALPGAIGVTITLSASPLHTAVTTNEAVRRVDERQYAVDEGPCVEAIRTNQFQRMANPEVDQRWPAFTAIAEEEGIGSVLGVPLLAGDEVIGALNVYASQPYSFTDDHGLAAQMLADQASVALFNTRTYDDCGERVRQLQEALESRVVIEQAKGILMARERCSADVAFEILKAASQRANRKLRTIAGDLVESVTGTG